MKVIVTKCFFFHLGYVICFSITCALHARLHILGITSKELWNRHIQKIISKSKHCKRHIYRKEPLNPKPVKDRGYLHVHSIYLIWVTLGNTCFILFPPLLPSLFYFTLSNPFILKYDPPYENLAHNLGKIINKHK